jgi:hypothetical protein
MNDNVRRFCESVHGKLETLDGRLDSLKLNIGTTCHSLQEKLEEVRQRHEASRQPLTDARTRLELWFEEYRNSTKQAIDRPEVHRDARELAARARQAEECAWTAIAIAEASIDDAERMILEAVSAKLDAEAASHR